jgi:hypothetical protein
MRKTAILFVLALLLVSNLPALADGMFYWPEPVPPGVPYQRALLLFDGQYETLVVQSQYHLPGASEEEFGWVVPVPAVPDLASMDPQAAEGFFRELATRSQPTVIDPLSLLWIALGSIIAGGAILILLLYLLSFYTPRLQWVRWHHAGLFIGANLVLLLAVMCYLVIYISPRSFFNPFSPPEGTGVDLLREVQVGIYDVQVVSAEGAGDLIQWLDENQFQFDESDTRLFDQYITQGWCFVVAKIDPARAGEDQAVASEGLVAPLILRFPAGAPVYPLALTSTAGQETQILLYLLSEHKWQANGRLALQYAAPTGRAAVDNLYSRLEQAGAPAEPQGFFSGAERELTYLCKFKGTLAPDQMREDLILAPAENDRSYNRYDVIWFW